MKHIRRYLAGLSLLAALSGCDVSNNGGGSDTQAPDPVVVDFPIAYIERPLPRDEDGELIASNIMDVTAFNPGARLMFKARASVPAEKIVLTDIAFMPAAETDPETGENIPLPEDFRPQYDVKDLSVSPDGSKLLFAMRAPEIENADEEDQPTWNIWEYDLETEMLRRIITSDIVAEEGQDINPAFLADGRIIFSSNRQRRSRAVLLDENKPQFAALTENGESEAFVLHVMEDDGTGIKQITFNQSHDLYPTQLSDGRIMFLRWDNYRDSKDHLSLYTANPNGSNVTLEYGFHSQMTGTNDSEGVFVKPRELDDGRVQVTLRPRESARLGGSMVAIDTAEFTEYNVAVSGTGASGPAQTSLVGAEIVTDGSPSPAGYYNSAYPIDDGTGRMLVSWSPCQLNGYKLGIYIDENLQLIGENGQFVDEDGEDLGQNATPITIDSDEVGNFPCTAAALELDNIVLAPPVYGLWIFDPTTQTQAPVVLSELGTMNTEALVMQPRALPNYIPDPIPGIDFDQKLADENVGIVHIRSVYDVDGIDISPNGILATADPLQTPESERPARFLRILKAVSMADDDVVDFDNSAFGRSGGQMKDILGYVPIEPDGSAMFKVPADVAFTFSILDARGRRVTADGTSALGPRHEYWMALRAGEVRQCNGCHANGESPTPHGRFGAEPPSINPGALASAPFPNTQLRDEFGTPHEPPQVGETMAEYYARLNGPRQPNMNIVDYSDWTEDGTRPRTATLDLNYSDLETAAPTDCITDWSSLCRTVINYLEHIQPLWDKDRRFFDPVEEDLLVADFTCTSCHNTVDANGAAMIPAGNRQLNLNANQSAERDDYVNSYAQLLFGSLIQEIDENGNLRNQTEQLVIDGEPQFQTVQLTIDDVPQYVYIDANGQPVAGPINSTDPNLIPVLDNNGNQVPALVLEVDSEGNPVPILVETGNRNGAIMSPNGALGSNQFFAPFLPGGSHEGYLDGAELKLIAEWLDIGGQYYNNPFDAP
ncbi:PD40 domain-containing protein [Teredinibacter turnerae]|uniref:HzsA-related protein n=1 Tax=Teredinibacter turnerae TaxID=2426 RepID=UPI00036DF00F|nr:PD40 domain-containing protein [Teredinibacter turnerae]